MKKILVVIDMQNDFIDGPLGTPEARGIVDNVVEKIREGEWDYIYVTIDTHFEDYLDTQEGLKLPVPHCIQGTEGWYINAEVGAWLNDCTYTEALKNTFACIDLPDMIGGFAKVYGQRNIEITLVGVCTDICVITNTLLLKTHFPEARIVVDASCCAGTTPEMHQKALDVMRSCQIDIVVS